MLMGTFFTAVGCFASSLTSSQIVAAIITVGLLLIHHLVGYVTVIWGDSFAAAPVFRYISSQEHLRYFAKGLIDTRPVVYYLSMAVFVLILTHHAIDFRRWKR
jgi:ABC-2 type transport system permease protein